MSKKILAKTEGMLREEWLALRKQGIGGSDAAAACGLSRWKSPLGLWLEKTEITVNRQDWMLISSLWMRCQ